MKETPRAELPPPSKANRIQRVEDHAIYPKLAVSSLRKAAYEVDIAENGIEALAAVARWKS